jgi:Ni,Fe-hydrogenase I large subunit
MAERKKEVRIDEVNDFVKEVNSLVKENYLLAIDAARSLLEENAKVLNAHVDQVLKLQRDYVEYAKTNLEKFPFQPSNLQFVNGNLEQWINLQKSYINTVRGVSEKVTRSWVNLNQKLVERFFASVEENLELFKS